MPINLILLLRQVDLNHSLVCKVNVYSLYAKLKYHKHLQPPATICIYQTDI